ncbi:MAG: UPF0280 family protein [Candidatus Odinarchaeota archaeon]
MKRHYFRINQTIATIIVEEKYLLVIEREVLTLRQELENYVLENPLFLASLEPCDIRVDAPDIVKLMAISAKRAGVGPMASVAGAIAYHAVAAAVDAGADHIIFDNGGDIALFINKPIVVGIYAGDLGIKGLGFKVIPREEIIGICTSSGTIGPSLSFGNADAATVISEDVILADALATALGNAVTKTDNESIVTEMENLVTYGIEGMLVLVEDKLAIWGVLPRIVKANVDYSLITKA